MKLPITIAAVALIAIATGTVQQRELNRLRVQTKSALDAVNQVANEAPHQAPAAYSSTASPDLRELEEEEGTHTAEGDKIALKAAKFIRLAEEVVSKGSQAEATIKLTPQLILASPELLKEILAQLNASTLAEPPKQKAWLYILKQLGKKEPAEAIRIALEESGQAVSLFPDLFHQWIDRDAAAAEAWYAQAKASGEFPAEPELTKRVEISLFGAIADRDLDEAIKLITAEEGSKRDGMLQGLRESVSNLDEWSELASRTVGAEDPALKESLLVVLSDKAFAFGTTEEQFDRIGRLGVQGEALDAFALSAMGAALEKKSAALAAWGIERLPERDLHFEVMRLAVMWWKIHPEGAKAWVESLPAGAARDIGMRALKMN